LRLTDFEIRCIKDIYLEVFQSGRVYLFGSRVDDSRRGGDIDLYMDLDYSIDTKEQITKEKEFKIKLYDKIGEQKIDLVISKDKKRSIEKEIIRTGVLL
jgi:predicted nucleotidyltransferase